MADDKSFSFEEATGAPPDNPDGSFSFEHASGTDADTPETSRALRETDMLGQHGGPAQGILGRLLGLRDPHVAPSGKIATGGQPTGQPGTIPLTTALGKPADMDPRQAYAEATKDQGFSPLMGAVAEAGYRMNPFLTPVPGLPMGAAMQLFPEDHPVRQVLEGSAEAVRGTARALSEEDNLALMVATGGVGPVADRVLSGAFALQIASAFPEQWRAFKIAPDLKSKVAIAGQMLGTAGFTGLAGYHAIRGGVLPGPPLEHETSLIPKTKEGQLELAQKGLEKGWLTQPQFDEMVDQLGETTKPVTEEAAPEAAPVEAPKPEETDEAAEARARKAQQRLTRLGGDWESIHRQVTEERGESPTWGEFANELEDEIKDIQSSRQQLTLMHRGAAKELGISTTQYTKALNRQNEVRRLAALKISDAEEKALKDRGIRFFSSPPNINVTEELGGYRIQVEPQTSMVEEPGAQTGMFKGRPVYAPSTTRRLIKPAQDWFLPKTGGKIIEYADKPYTPTDEVPDVKGKPAEPGTEEPPEKGGPREAPPERPQPGPTADRPVVTETPSAPAGPERYVIEDLRDPTDPDPKKRIGYIVKDRQTGRPVARFQADHPHPNEDDLLEQREKAREHIKKLTEKVAEGVAESEEPEREPILVAGGKRRKKEFTVRADFDEFGNSPKTPVATAVTDMGGILSKSAAQAQGKYEGNEALWNDLPKLSHLTHKKIWNKDGVMPDVAAQTLYNDGLIPEPFATDMHAALEKESASIRSEAKAAASAPEKQAGVKTQIRQAENFGKAQRTEGEEGGEAVPVESLNVGDTVNVDGTDLKVVDVDPEGNVTLEDGRRYGIQQMSDGDVVYGEVTTPSKAKPVEYRPGEVGKHGQRAMDMAGTNPIGARRAAFESDRATGQHIHKDKRIVVRYNKAAKQWEVVDSNTGKVVDTGDTRRETLDEHLDGLVRGKKQPIAETPPSKVIETPTDPGEGEPEYDFTSVEGFEKAIKDLHNRDLTDEERKAFEPIVRQIRDQEAKAAKTGSDNMAKLLKKLKDAKDISFDDAVKQIQDAITDATKGCG